MTLDKAKKKYQEFHLKNPNEVVVLGGEIPSIVYPVGFCSQVSYNSNKWNKRNKWKKYIHYWEHPTLVCVPEMALTQFESIGEGYDIGDNRSEVTFLGYAVDFDLTEDDRSNINPDMPGGEEARAEGARTFVFNDKPSREIGRGSKDYVVCSPDGDIIYVIARNGAEVYTFLNDHCKVTRHGIEG